MRAVAYLFAILWSANAPAQQKLTTDDAHVLVDRKDALLQASWARVAAKYPDVGVAGSPSYVFVQGKIDSIAKADSSFFDQPTWPEALAMQYSVQLNALKDSRGSGGPSPTPFTVATTHTVHPDRNLIFWPQELMHGSYNDLTIQNGTKHYAIVKLGNTVTLKADYVFGVCAGETQKFKSIRDGSYVVMFALGDEVRDDNITKFSPCISCSQFEQAITFITKTEGNSVVSSDPLITLNPVPGGTAKTRNISETDFTRW